MTRTMMTRMRVMTTTDTTIMTSRDPTSAASVTRTNRKALKTAKQFMWQYCRLLYNTCKFKLLYNFCRFLPKSNGFRLKHRLVQIWAELDHRHIAAAVGQWRPQCMCNGMHKVDNLNIFALDFTYVYSSSVQSICWLRVLYRITSDFVLFVLWGFNSY